MEGLLVPLSDSPRSFLTMMKRNIRCVPVIIQDIIFDFNEFRINMESPFFENPSHPLQNASEQQVLRLPMFMNLMIIREKLSISESANR